MATLIVDTSTNFRDDPAEQDVTQITFDGDLGESVIALISPNQFLDGEISSSLLVEGGLSLDTLHVAGRATTGHPFSAAGWTFANWDLTDLVEISGSKFRDSMTGSVQSDLIRGLGGSDVLHGLENDDTLIGSSGNDRLFGELGDDSLEGGGGNDRLEGGAGDDTQYGGNGNDRLTGAEGNDSLVAGSGNDHAWGDEGNDTIDGGDGNDWLMGGDGDDFIAGGDGIDHLIGGFGDDTYVQPADGEIVEEENGGIDTVMSSVSFSLGRNANVENLILTGGGNINGIGSALDNLIVGNDGANILLGGAGNDTLIGHGGLDRLEGGAGNDTYVNPIDGEIVEGEGSAWGDHDVVLSDASFSLGRNANVEDLVLTGAGNINGIGSDLDNRITGNDGDNILLGGAGNDTLIGNDGTDRMEGGEGNDTYVNPVDGEIVENAGPAWGDHDVVYSNASFSLARNANVEDLVLTGTDDVNGVGSNADNAITGNDGNNILLGGGGNDTLEGGAGNDALDGGPGADVYVFGSGSGADTINGADGDDRFYLDGDVFSSALEAGGNTSLTYGGGTILVTGVTGLSLDDWNALVLPTFGGEAASPDPDYLG